MHGRNSFFCGRQGIALRGHRDNWKHVKDAPEETFGSTSIPGTKWRHHSS